jgi:hypothetical protein
MVDECQGLTSLSFVRGTVYREEGEARNRTM